MRLWPVGAVAAPGAELAPWPLAGRLQEGCSQRCEDARSAALLAHQASPVAFHHNPLYLSSAAVPGFFRAQKCLSAGTICRVPARRALVGSAAVVQPLASSCPCLGEARSV